MSTLAPHQFVWLPELDAGQPEPAPMGAERVARFHLRRRIHADRSERLVRIETHDGGRAPLPRRIRCHGDPDEEGWDWGWRGSAPLETALNVLAVLVHPKRAWRLQWAFCEAFLHPLPPAGGIVEAEDVRRWLERHEWVGRQGSWHAAARAEYRIPLQAETAASAGMDAESRARRVHALVLSALRWNAEDRAQARAELPELYTLTSFGAEGLIGGDEPGSAGYQIDRAVALLGGAPADQRWPTLAHLSALLDAEASRTTAQWDRIVPFHPGLPKVGAVHQVAAIHRASSALNPAERASFAVRWLQEGSSPAAELLLGGWADLPYSGQAGDLVETVATLAALLTHVRAEGEVPGWAEGGIRERIEALRELHLTGVSTAVSEVVRGAEERTRYAAHAEAYREPRGRAPFPAEATEPLRRFVLATPLETLLAWRRALQMDGPDEALRRIQEGGGVPADVYDPAPLILAAVAWFAEERMPPILDRPAFPARGDALYRTPPAAFG